MRIINNMLIISYVKRCNYKTIATITKDHSYIRGKKRKDFEVKIKLPRIHE